MAQWFLLCGPLQSLDTAFGHVHCLLLAEMVDTWATPWAQTRFVLSYTTHTNQQSHFNRDTSLTLRNLVGHNLVGKIVGALRLIKKK